MTEEEISCSECKKELVMKFIEIKDPRWFLSRTGCPKRKDIPG